MRKAALIRVLMMLAAIGTAFVGADLLGPK
jgi:hypothetical protein